MSVLVDTDVPVGCGPVVVGGADLLGRPRAARPVAPSSAATDLVELARRSENDFVGAPTGILDQSASLLCTAGARAVPRHPRAAHRAGAAGPRRGGAGAARRRHRHLAHARRRRLRRPAPRVRGGRRAARRAGAARRRRRRGPGARWTTTRCCAGRGTSSPRTPGCSRWWPILRGSRRPARDRAGADRRARLAARRLPDLHRRARRLRRRGGRRPARTAPAWSAAGFGGSAVVLVDRGPGRAVAAAVRERFAREGYAAPRTFDVVPSAGARRLA